MASSRDIKRRISSVSNTQQITRAMKLVSSAKLRRTRTAWQAADPYCRRLTAALRRLAPSCSGHPWLAQREGRGRVLYVAIGSERGLAGSFNVCLHRFLDEVLACEYREYDLLASGHRLVEFCRRRGYHLIGELEGVGDCPDFETGRRLAQRLTDSFDKGEYCAVYLVHAGFHSSLVPEALRRRLLPLPPPEEDAPPEREEDDFIFEPSPEEVLNALLPLYADTMVYTALVEAKAAEHGARMAAMSAATDNAREMISTLTLSLNRARQAAITTEISEIVGGAAALT